MSRQQSPEFDDHDFEPILKWGEASIEECRQPHDPHELFGYTLLWPLGFIHLDVETEEEARKAGALFIYLWTRGVCANFAERCATGYVRTYKITRI